MKERLIIKNFGPIKSVDLELSRFNILIGEQATGKSTVAKVLAVCRTLQYISDTDSNISTYNSFADAPFFQGLSIWGLEEAFHNNSYINYECAKYSLTVEIVNTGQESGIPTLLPILKSNTPEFTDLINQVNRTPINARMIIYSNEIEKILDTPFYIPTERGLQSIFSLGRASIQNISDSLFNQLAELDRVARNFKSETFIEPLNIYYVNRDGHGFVRKADEERYYSLYNAASGYQSTIPVVLTIKYYTEKIKENKTFLIEEPELNLFPSAQDNLMRFLVEKTMNFGNSVLLTTQSPYVLASLNNLIYAYKVGADHKEKVNKVVLEKYWLNPLEVSAYRLKDGKAYNIIDEELQEIRVEEIDEAGKQINKDYDKMLDLKFETNDKSE